MSRTGRGKVGKNITSDIDTFDDDMVVYGVDGLIERPSPLDNNSNQIKTNLPLEGQGQKREDKKMPFVGFDKAKLQEKFPSTFGRGSGKPTVAISPVGRMQFNVEVSKIFEGCKVVSPSFDSDANKFRLQGMAETPKGKEGSVFDLVKPKEGAKNKSKSLAISGSLLLKAVGYDYAKAGNQTYEVEKMDADKKVIIFSIPKETPTPKPTRPRKVKAVAPATTATTPANGAAASATTSAASKAAMGAKADVVDDEDVVVEE